MNAQRSTLVSALALTATVALLASACSSSPTPAAVGSPAALSAVDIPEGRVDDAVAQLDDLATGVMQETGIPGMAIAVVHGDRTIYAKGFGVADVGTGAPVDADTIFQLASTSKPIGATVVASVVGTGEVAWDDPVVKHYPQFRLSDPYVTTHATIGDMYAMRSGLPDKAGDDLEELGYSRAQIIDRFRLLPLEPFRNQSQYTNFGLTAGAESVARAVGVPWEQLSKDRLYAPLGMTRTTSRYDEYLATPNRTTLHVRKGGTWVANGHRDEQAQAPAGQVSSSANDLARWMRMWLASGTFEGREVVKASALQQSLVPRIAKDVTDDPLNRPSSYGYGIGINTDATARVRYQFSGAYSQGAATHVTFLPAADLGIFVLTNAYPIGAAEGLAAEFLDLVELGTVAHDWVGYWGERFAAALGDDAKPPARPTNAKSATPLAAYAGTYDNAYYGPVTITLDGKDGLVASLGPKPYVMQLRPWDGNVFAFVTPDGGLVPAAEFVVTNGVATQVQFGGLQAPGQGAFTRR